MLGCERAGESIATCGDARLDIELVLHLPDGSKRKLPGKLFPSRYPRAAFSEDCSRVVYVCDNEVGEMEVVTHEIATDSTQSYPAHCCPPNVIPFAFNGFLYVLMGSDYDVRILSVRRGIYVAQRSAAIGSLLNDASGFTYLTRSSSEEHVAKFDTLLAADVKWIDPPQGRAAIEARHLAVFRALVGQDFGTLANFVHPSLGLRISQFAYVGMSDPVFQRAQIVNAMSDTTTIVVGEGDGSGEPIYSSLKKEMLVLAGAAYAEADSVSFNQQIYSGNCFNNVSEFYPGSIFVEYYWSGTGEQADFNWASRRFVYVGYKGEWFLTAVTFDHWCI